MDVDHQHRPLPPATRRPDILHLNLQRDYRGRVCRGHYKGLNRNLLKIAVYVSGARVWKERDSENVLLDQRRPVDRWHRREQQARVSIHD